MHFILQNCETDYAAVSAKLDALSALQKSKVHRDD
jgi:low affinity Fe/Cu permease